MPPESTGETQLVAVPATLYVLEGAEFILRVRHFDPYGGVVPIPDGSLAWTASDGLVAGSKGADSIVLTAPPADGRTSLAVSATMNDLSTSSTIIVVPSIGPASSEDRLIAVAEQYPEFALVAGDARLESASPTALESEAGHRICRRGSSIAFVGVGLIGEMIGNCPAVAARPEVKGEVTVFSPGHGVFRQDVAWSDDFNTVTVSAKASDAVSAVARPARLPVPYVVANAASGASPALINADIDLARRLFRQAGTGLDVQGALAPELFPAASVVVASLNAPLECANVRTELESAGIRLNFTGSALTVVYVDDILGPAYGASETTHPSGLLGYSCPPTATDGLIILIAAGVRSPTTLAHELGHALGLRDDAGHTNGLPGFGYTNLMWAGQDPSHAVARSQFTLGQAYRMNFDTRSWLHRTSDAAAARPKPERNCGPAESIMVCPRLAWDVAVPPGA